MATFLGNYINDYEEILEKDITQYGKIYSAFNIKKNRKCCLKVINKEQMKIGDYDFLMERINREEQLTKICKSKNIVELYEKYENEDNIIFELEYCDLDLYNYLQKNGEITDKAFLRKIILDIGNALKKINKEGIMHRDIKPNNIFLDEDETTAKLGDFGCSIYIKDNEYDSIGTILYTAPEILQNLEYNEKCDLWSLGVTLHELYFGFVPYGPEANTNIMMQCIFNEQFLYKKSKIPSFDILLNRLLQRNPDERMSFEEFFKIIFDEDFMQNEEQFLNKNEKYRNLYNNTILNQPEAEYEETTIPEGDDPILQNEYNKNKIMTLVKGGHFPDIMNFPNGSVNKEEMFNNILYYDENKDFKNAVNQDSDYFETITPGAFILCTNLDSLNLIVREIISQNKKDKKTIFNMITTGSACDKIMEYLNKNNDFKNCINKICIFCINLERWSSLKDKYTIIDGVYNSQKKVKLFIEKYSSKDIKPFPVTKLIRYEDYINKYKERHEKISEFYGNLTVETYKKNMKELKKIIKEEDEKKELKKNQNILLKGFLTFEIKKDLELLDKLIIREYTKNTYYGDLNKWLMNSKMNSFEAIAYFTARLMYSLNNYGKDNKMFYNEDKTILRRGIKIPYSCLLPYERAKGKIILLSSFTSTTEKEVTARNFSGRNNSQKQYKTQKLFSVIYIISNLKKPTWIANGINVQKVSVYDEKEILFQPFSFYLVKDIKIDVKNYIADIYLETIGKTEILEEKIKEGKNIIYNKNKGIMEVKI